MIVTQVEADRSGTGLLLIYTGGSLKQAADPEQDQPFLLWTHRQTRKSVVGSVLGFGIMGGIGESPFKVKGVAYAGALEFYDAEVEGGSRAVLERLEPELRGFASQRFLPSGWYDIFPFLELDRAAAHLSGTTLDNIARRASEWQARRELQGIYKVFVKLLGASHAANVFGRLMGQYYNFGQHKLVPHGKTEVYFEIGGCPSELATWLPTVILAYVRTLLELAGAKEVAPTRVESTPDGSFEGYPLVKLEARLRWK
ncbi:MAG: hypothetical protein H6718_18880 [Polyangiaceae bacterium]|nr:hypothetical protein [Polyangiaceae bacterium]MCB9605730.1 hypothetical protein [Polyangiaceae bacterium]